MPDTPLLHLWFLFVAGAVALALILIVGIALDWKDEAHDQDRQ